MKRKTILRWVAWAGVVSLAFGGLSGCSALGGTGAGELLSLPLKFAGSILKMAGGLTRGGM